MELSIKRYCTLLPQKVIINGQVLVNIEVQESLEKSLVEIYRFLGFDYIKFFKMDNLSKLAIMASEILLKDTELYEIEDKFNVAVVLANASSSIVADTKYQKTITSREDYFPSPSLFVYTLPNIAIGEICIRHKIHGENVFLIGKKFDTDLLCFYVNELFENTDTQHCLTGWVECNEETYEAFLLLVEKGTGSNKFEINTLEKLYLTK
jgi:hypothetical protein